MSSEMPTGRGSGRPLRGGVSGRRSVILVLFALVLAGCSDAQKKLSDGGPADILLYQVLGQERPTSYYYELVRDSHDAERFCYRCTDDPYLVDKSINAVTKLGDAPYARLEGQAVVVGKLTEVLLEDPSALGQAGAAGSLTKIGAKLPVYPQAGPPETGARFVQLLQEMDGLHDQNGVRRPGEGPRQRLMQIVTQIGDFQITDLVLAKESVRPFHNRAFLVDETDPELRTAIDTALTKRLGALIRVALEAAVPAESPWVRADAIRGLKVLAEPAALPAVVQQLEVDPSWQVRGEAVEYLGRIGNADAVAALLPLVSESDPSVRHKSLEALRRIAGQDFGRRRAAWVRWARRTYPELANFDREDDEVPPEAEEADVPVPVTPQPGPSLPTGPQPVPPQPDMPVGPPSPVQPIPPLPSGADGPISDIPPPAPGALPDPVVRDPRQAQPVRRAPTAPRAGIASPPPPPPPQGVAVPRGVPRRSGAVPPPPPPPTLPRSGR
ncbi:MAG: HEAT repeat domain-containing protein [Planctomycetota bacterium]|nr:HEAT repeat domain-containing protein [Planctomycetota bacterium]